MTVDVYIQWDGKEEGDFHSAGLLELHFTWGDMAWLEQTADRLNVIKPFPMYNLWSGLNEDVFVLNPTKRLPDNSQERFQKYLDKFVDDEEIDDHWERYWNISEDETWMLVVKPWQGHEIFEFARITSIEDVASYAQCCREYEARIVAAMNSYQGEPDKFAKKRLDLFVTQLQECAAFCEQAVKKAEAGLPNVSIRVY